MGENLPIKTKKENQSVDSFISTAIKMNAPVETLERLFTLREKINKEQAITAFNAAMESFQNDCPIIKKTKKVMQKDGKSVRYMFAPLDSIVEQIKKPLKQNGFSYEWDTVNDKEAKTMKAICTVTHTLGHSKSSSFEIPTDSEGYMTAPQKVASALTFAKRYSLCNALGISTSDEDTDATDVGKEKDVKSPKSKIIFLLKTLNCDTTTKEAVEKAVAKHAKLTLEEGNFSEIVTRLEVLVKERNEANSDEEDIL